MKKRNLFIVIALFVLSLNCFAEKFNEYKYISTDNNVVTKINRDIYINGNDFSTYHLQIKDDFGRIIVFNCSLSSNTSLVLFQRNDMLQCVEIYPQPNICVTIHDMDLEHFYSYLNGKDVELKCKVIKIKYLK